MKYKLTLIWLSVIATVICGISVHAQPPKHDAKDMLDVPYIQGDPARIAWSKLPKITGEWGMVSEGTPDWKFRLHSYLCYYDGKYWAMWSHGPVVEDHPTQHVRYATSDDGVNWSEAKVMMPPDSDPEIRYISRGFWIRDGHLLALASRDEARTNGRIHFFGKSLKLLAFEWNKASSKWEKKGLVFNDAINNFPPKQLPNGKWMMSRRDHKMNKSMLIGGVQGIDDWKAVDIAVPKDNARLEEPFWWVLPDGTLAGLFRDNSRSMRLYRAFSSDNGQTWTQPVRTDFPDATSKFNALRTSRGYYVMASNANPSGRDPLCLSVSEDGLRFTRMAALPTPGKGSFQYPHLIEHDDHLLLIYSHNKTSIETLKIPFSEIEKLRKRTDIVPISRSVDDKNIARTAEVKVSSVLDGFVGENAIDGDSNPYNRDTRWVSSSKAKPPHWLELDFKRPRKINWVRLQFNHGFGAVEYRLQYDRDGQWVDVPGASISGGDRSSDLQEFDFSTPIETERMRLYVTDGSSYDATYGNLVRLSEIEVYATKDGVVDRSNAAPDPVSNPTSRVMLSLPGAPANPNQIKFDQLPHLPSKHAVISDMRAGQRVNQHAYLTYYDGRFWAMWSDGPEREDKADQRVFYSTSPDGLTWSKPQDMSGPPKEGFGFISRGFWQREGELLTLMSHFRAPGYPGQGLSLETRRWNRTTQCWEDAGTTQDDTLNNFPPKKLSTGEWMMSRRDHQRHVSMLVGGVKAFNQWKAIPLASYSGAKLPEEPYWYVLPDGKNLVALFRDNSGSKRLYRAFSVDDGRSWSKLTKTNFPDATSKFNVLRTSRDYYVLISNPNPQKRDPLTLSVSKDGLVYTAMFYLVGGRHVDYPHVIEHDGNLLISFSGAKQTVEVLTVSLDAIDELLSENTKKVSK